MRILSETGNVIAADFRPEAPPLIEVKSELLYCDQLVCLMRFSLYFHGHLISTQHLTAQQHGNQP